MNAVLVPLALAAVGLVHLLPGVVALSPRRAEQAYGVAVDGPDLTVVLQHRGVLLTLVGVGLLVSAVWSPLRPHAVAMAAASMLSFVVLVATRRGVGPRLRRVMWVDVGALLVLAPVALTL